MDKKKLDKYKKLLLSMKSEILNSGILRKRDDLEISTDDLPDEADIATNVINQQISFSMRNRELAKIRNIEEALLRIEEGTYGLCEECDEEITERRLEKQPWADLCITHAEEKEREEAHINKFA